MGTQDPRRASDPPWKARARAAPAALAVLLVLGLLAWGAVAVVGPGGGDGEGDSRTRSAPGATGLGAGFRDASAFSVSYAGAARRLDGLTKPEKAEQVRDWARFGLAARLDMSTAGYRNAAYDTLPVRDSAFDGLTRQPTGPGRSLYDGPRGILHVLVPHDDRHAARTVALQIDQHRTDTGSDPRAVQVHRYRPRPASASLRVTVGAPSPTKRVREKYGFVTARVDTAEGLKGFLGRADRLTSLKKDGKKLWASGWDWGKGASPVTAEDVAVLQRGYTRGSGPRPAFSLDPAKARTAADVRAAFPGLDPRHAARIARGEQPAGLADKAEDALFHGARPSTLKAAGLPTDRTELWALAGLLRGGPAYTQARYDGGLAGTEVGMTLWYTDYVAKHWVAGVGTGVPAKAVGGFVPNSRADIPWGECTRSVEPESGRLWFGPGTSGYAFAGDRVDIGARSTRLFAKADSGAGEVEPSYAMGRGLRWWDQHYEEVADHEPQYRRLDEIMRWSGALDWLTRSPDGPRLPRPGGDGITSDLRFKDWYADHDELRERGHIAFVKPPSARQEALHNAPSKTFEQCGHLNISGGVSLADRLDSRLGGKAPAELPHGARRAGGYDRDSSFDARTGEGRFTQVWKDAGQQGGAQEVTDRLQHTFSRGEGGGAEVRTKGRWHKAAAFLGGLKVRGASGTHTLREEMEASPGAVRHTVETDGHVLGEMYADTSETGVVGIRWQPGLLDRFAAAARTAQDRLLAADTKGEATAPGASDVLYGTERGDGPTRYKVGGTDDHWLEFAKGDAADGAEMYLRLGAPGAGTGGPEHTSASLVRPGRNGPGGPRGPPRGPPGGGDGGGWMEVGPPGGGEGRPATVRLDSPRPDENAEKITVENAEGQTSTVHTADGRLRVRADDELLGWNGPVVGAAFLRDHARIAGQLDEARGLEHGLVRPIELRGGDGFVLAGAEKTVLIPPDGAWADRLRAALDGATPQSVPALRYERGTGPQRVGENTLSPVRGRASKSVSLGSLVKQNRGRVYVSDRLEAQLSRSRGVNGRAPAHDVSLTVVEAQHKQVTAREFEVRRKESSGEKVTDRPEVYTYGGENWTRVGPAPPHGAGGPAGSGSSGISGSSGKGGKGGASGSGSGTRTNTVFLACAPDEDTPGCDDD